MNEYVYDPIVLTVKQYLESVQDVPVHNVAPDQKPERFIQITPVGGTDGVVSQSPMVTFICWGRSDLDAAELAEDVKAHMKQCQRLGGLPVYRRRTVGLPVPRPDPETGRSRYQFTLELRVRGRNFNP